MSTAVPRSSAASTSGIESDGTSLDHAEADLVGLDPVAVDLSHAFWRKSSYSGGNGSCVEVADLGEHVAVRDSKDREGPTLVFTREAWRGFMGELKAGVHHP